MTDPTHAPGRIAQLLRAARERLGLTLREMEPRAEMSNAYLSQLERGRICDPSVKTIRRLSRGYEIPEAQLLGPGADAGTMAAEFAAWLRREAAALRDRAAAMETYATDLESPR